MDGVFLPALDALQGRREAAVAGGIDLDDSRFGNADGEVALGNVGAGDGRGVGADVQRAVDTGLCRAEYGVYAGTGVGDGGADFAAVLGDLAALGIAGLGGGCRAAEVLVEQGFDIRTARDDVHVVDAGLFLYGHVGDRGVHRDARYGSLQLGALDIGVRRGFGLGLDTQLAPQIQGAGGAVLPSLGKGVDGSTGDRRGDIGLDGAVGDVELRRLAHRRSGHGDVGKDVGAARFDGVLAAGKDRIESTVGLGDHDVDRHADAGQAEGRRLHVRVGEGPAFGGDFDAVGDVGRAGLEDGIHIRRDGCDGGVGFYAQQAEFSGQAAGGAYGGDGPGIVRVIEGGCHLDGIRLDAAARDGGSLPGACVGICQVDGDAGTLDGELRRLDFGIGGGRAGGGDVQHAAGMDRALADGVCAGDRLDLGDGQVDAHVHQARADAAHGGIDHAVGVSQIIRADGQIPLHVQLAAPVGARIGLEPACRVGEGVHQAHGDGRDGQVVHLGLRLGQALAVHGQVAPDGQVVAPDAGDARGVGRSARHIGVDRKSACGSGEDVGLRHGIEYRGEVRTAAEVVLFDRGGAVAGTVPVLLGLDGHVAVQDHLGRRVDLGRLVRLQVRHGSGYVGCDGAHRRVDDDAVGVGLAVGADIHAAGFERTALAGDARRVLRSVHGHAEVDRGCHAARRAGDHQGLCGGGEGLGRRPGVQIDRACLDLGIGGVDPRTALAALVGHGHGGADAHSAAHHAGGIDLVVARKGRRNVQAAAGFDIGFVRSRDVLHLVDAQHDEAVDSHAAGGDADAVDIQIRLDGIIDAHTAAGREDLALDSCGAAGLRCFAGLEQRRTADVGAAVGLGDVRNDAYAYAHQAARCGDEPHIGGGIKVTGKGDVAGGLCLDAFADVGVHIQLIVGQGGVHGDAGSCCADGGAGYRGDRIGLACGGHIDLAYVLARLSDLGRIRDGRGHRAFEPRAARGDADACGAADGHADHGGEHLVEVHLAGDIEDVRLGHIARHNGLYVAGDDQRAKGHGHAGHAAAARDHADLAHRGAGDLAALVTVLIVHFAEYCEDVCIADELVGSFTAAGGGLDGDVSLGIQHCPAAHGCGNIGIQHAHGDAGADAGRAADACGARHHQGGERIAGYDIDLLFRGHLGALIYESGGAVRQQLLAGTAVDAGIAGTEAVRAGVDLAVAQAVGLGGRHIDAFKCAGIASGILRMIAVGAVILVAVLVILVPVGRLVQRILMAVSLCVHVRVDRPVLIRLFDRLGGELVQSLDGVLIGDGLQIPAVVHGVPAVALFVIAHILAVLGALVYIEGG